MYKDVDSSDEEASIRSSKKKVPSVSPKKVQTKVSKSKETKLGKRAFEQYYYVS